MSEVMFMRSREGVALPREVADTGLDMGDVLFAILDRLQQDFDTMRQVPMRGNSWLLPDWVREYGTARPAGIIPVRNHGAYTEVDLGPEFKRTEHDGEEGRQAEPLKIPLDATTLFFVMEHTGGHWLWTSLLTAEPERLRYEMPERPGFARFRLKPMGSS